MANCGARWLAGWLLPLYGYLSNRGFYWFFLFSWFGPLANCCHDARGPAGPIDGEYFFFTLLLVGGADACGCVYCGVRARERRMEELYLGTTRTKGWPIFPTSCAETVFLVDKFILHFAF